eukprot:GGOE01045073.1.p1 GENE.GGOE01045073.1~~GGOE01045073.1.p1  ORF type:complete len:229 (+),score=47.56 GGOE01045073.1:115-801(+)
MGQAWAQAMGQATRSAAQRVPKSPLSGPRKPSVSAERLHVVKKRGQQRGRGGISWCIQLLQQQFTVTIETAAPRQQRGGGRPWMDVVQRWLRGALRQTVRSAVDRLTDSQPKPKLKHELRCKEILEGLFQRPFPKVRPPWLINPTTGRRLELDMYCHELALAVEYDGIQHAQFTELFHKDRADFEAQQHRDRVKDARCRENGVVLIRCAAKGRRGNVCTLRGTSPGPS